MSDDEQVVEAVGLDDLTISRIKLKLSRFLTFVCFQLPHTVKPGCSTYIISEECVCKLILLVKCMHLGIIHYFQHYSRVQTVR